MARNQVKIKKSGGVKGVWSAVKRRPGLYAMILPAIVFFAVFAYAPMYGMIIAFKEYTPLNGIWGSKWVGLQQFRNFFGDVYFLRLLRNTLRINLFDLLFSFPLPIILALLLNEVGNATFKRSVQTVSYIPHFISMVVVCGMIKQFVGADGFITKFLGMFGVERVSLLGKPEYYVPIHIISNIWQTLGWNSIIYIAAMSGIDSQLYEAATIDGAGRLRKILHVTIPGILGTITILLIMRIGNILSVGYEKIILLYNPNTYETADVISSYVYRKGLQEFNWSYATAVGMFNSVINIILLTLANAFAKRVGQEGLF